MISIISLNTWKDEGYWVGRMDAIAAGLRRLQPDVVCLQEVFEGGGRDTAAVLSEATGLRATIAPARRKIRNSVESTSGVAVLTRVVPAASNVIDLPSTGRDGGRCAIACDLVLGGVTISVVSLHLSHLQDPDAGSLRQAQLDCVLQATASDEGRPLILAGDFNARIDAPELSALTGPGWVTTATALAGHTTLHGRPGALIDHIALSGAGRLGLHQADLVIDRPASGLPAPSDHAGVRALLHRLG